jgi:hypothetical protein
MFALQNPQDSVTATKNLSVPECVNNRDRKKQRVNMAAVWVVAE